MTSFADKPGVWMLYDYEVGPYVMKVGLDVVPLAREAARQAYGRVGFWPFELTLREAVDLWEGRDQVTHPLDDSIVHFYYSGEAVPYCQDSERTEWVMFDNGAIGKICPDCQDKLGRKIG